MTEAMQRHRNLDASGAAPHSTSLVPRFVPSPLGILDASALELLLQSPFNRPEQHQNEPPDRPASSELARAYGGITSPRALPRRRRVGPMSRRWLSPAKLTPMHQRSTAVEPNAVSIGCVSTTDANDHDGLEPQHRAAQLAKASAPSRSKLKLHSGDSRARNPVDRRLAHLHRADPNRADAELRREIQWIHAHLPVRRLANATRCSLALRRQLLVDTLRTNLVRAELRDALTLWRWTITKQKEHDATRLRAFQQLVDLFDSLTKDQVARRFDKWNHWVAECKQDERVAAAVAIQRWYVHCVQLWSDRCAQRARSLAAVMALAALHVTRIQRSYRAHRVRRRLHIMLEAARRIQRFAASARRRWIEHERAKTTQQLQELYEGLLREQRMDALATKTLHRKARAIQVYWRQYAAWRQQVVVAYVDHLVDQVEFYTAVLSIQSRIRGYQCRFRMKRNAKAARTIMRMWRLRFYRSQARERRKMLVLERGMAASCLQRSFRRSQERKRHRAVMKQSTRPMYMRALKQSDSFRLRYHVPIVKSAASIIQSTWRRYIQHQRWKHQRETASRRIQRWYRRGMILFLWHDAVQRSMIELREHRYRVAVNRLVRWIKRCRQRRRRNQEALALRQLADTLAAVMAIQRYYRMKKDRWRSVLKQTLREALPSWRNAATTIQSAWRRYADRKQSIRERLQVADDDSVMASTLTLSELQKLLVKQQQVQEQNDQAARKIQRALRRHVDRRNGKLLMKKYKLLFQKELRRKQQRRIVHDFLDEKRKERATKQQKKTAQSGVLASSPSTPLVSSPEASAARQLPPPTESQPSATPSESSERDPASSGSDESDVVKCWSEEYQCYFSCNTRTGESSWV